MVLRLLCLCVAGTSFIRWPTVANHEPALPNKQFRIESQSKRWEYWDWNWESYLSLNLTLNTTYSNSAGRLIKSHKCCCDCHCGVSAESACCSLLCLAWTCSGLVFHWVPSSSLTNRRPACDLASLGLLARSHIDNPYKIQNQGR